MHNTCIDRDYLIDLDGQLVRKFSKRRFLKDILISFQWVTQMGLETPQFFSFQNISTNTVARGVQSLGQNWLWWAGWLSKGQNFCVNLAQTLDEQMLKVSTRYLHSYLIDCLHVLVLSYFLHMKAICCNKFSVIWQ